MTVTTWELVQELANRNGYKVVPVPDLCKGNLGQLIASNANGMVHMNTEQETISFVCTKVTGKIPFMESVTWPMNKFQRNPFGIEILDDLLEQKLPKDLIESLQKDLMKELQKKGIKGTFAKAKA